jgi:hypothetical protein
MPGTAAATDRLALQMPVKALKKGLFSSCLSPFVLHHFSRSFSVFVFSSLSSQSRFIILSPDKNTLYLPTQEKWFTYLLWNPLYI